MLKLRSATWHSRSGLCLIDHRFLPLLGLAGVAIAAIGTWLPAQWTASRKVAAVLQSE